MRVLAQIQWCETHGKTTIVADDPAFCVWGESIWESLLCVVVDAQVTRTTADPTPRPYNQCPDCDGTGTRAKPYNRPSKTTTTYASAEVDELQPCLCSVEPNQTEPNKRGQHDDHPEAP